MAASERASRKKSISSRRRRRQRAIESMNLVGSTENQGRIVVDAQINVMDLKVYVATHECCYRTTKFQACPL